MTHDPLREFGADERQDEASASEGAVLEGVDEPDGDALFSKVERKRRGAARRSHRGVKVLLWDET
ncbi:hypothetical protein [Paraburkholderia bryophila]|jgi:hypothetical protein|uniref:Uncharacterized protein n=1 Tax=Paraburkholderia bryophila TaxID=420952 RepID=A0A329CY88_9BURK|nr:hypothetical protein [Paraburkholderia bryophila]RAS38952.1 hypothetical protein BX591_101282 [Paraburkholderia bryophila]